MEIKEVNQQLYLGEKGNTMFSRFDVDGNYSDLFNTHEMPCQLDNGGIFVCLQGEAEFFLDLKNYKLKKGDMCVVFPFSIFQAVCKSDDFNGFGMEASIELFKDIQIPSSTDYYLYIKDNPCISLPENEQQMLTELCDMMVQKNERETHPFRKEITCCIFRVLYYEIASIYKKGEPIMQESVPRKDMLVRRFMYLLAKNCHKHREVDYYACKLCITPRYLSSVIKEKTGSTAKEWIVNTVIKQAKLLLNDNRLSVLQISDKLNFANPSFFNQYFKKHAGMTPKKFRDREG